MKVLLLEAGDDEADDAELDVPYAALSKQASHEVDWNDSTVPQSAACMSMTEQVLAVYRLSLFKDMPTFPLLAEWYIPAFPCQDSCNPTFLQIHQK